MVLGAEFFEQMFDVIAKHSSNASDTEIVAGVFTLAIVLAREGRIDNDAQRAMLVQLQACCAHRTPEERVASS